MLPETILENIPVWEKFKCTDISSRETVRAKREEGGTVFVYAKGKSRYGYRWSECQFLNRYDISSYDPNKKETDWHRRIRAIIKKLEASGLWPEKLEKLRELDKMTLEDRKEISNLYSNYLRSPHSIETYEEKSIKNALEIKRLYGTKYPFIIKHNDKGNPYVDTWYLWEMSDCKTKSMYFGKALNKSYKKDIENAIKNNEKIGLTARTSYDVSFYYEPKDNTAFYAEEYKDCGNGHYYIAIDHSTAWFCEDD